MAEMFAVGNLSPTSYRHEVVRGLVRDRLAVELRRVGCLGDVRYEEILVEEYTDDEGVFFPAHYEITAFADK